MRLIKNIFVFILFLSISSSVHSWPGGAVDTTDVDATNDDPSQARIDILDAFNKLNDIINDRGVANGIPSLDSGAKIPSSQIGTISGATINSSSVGATTASTGKFTTLEATGAGTFTSGAFSGAVTSTRACASGYTRLTPNYCLRDDRSSTGFTSMTVDTCTTIASPSANATKLHVIFLMGVGSGNSVAGRRNNTYTYTNSGCSTVSDHNHIYAWEVVATSGVTLVSTYQLMIAPIISSNSYAKFTSILGGGSTTSYKLYGYWD